MKTALLSIDLQNDYFPDGNMKLVGVEQAAATRDLKLKNTRVAAAQDQVAFMAALGAVDAQMLSTTELLAGKYP